MRFFSAIVTLAAFLVLVHPAAAQGVSSTKEFCDPDFETAMDARAFLHAQRETAQIRGMILKPDSVLDYSCFDEAGNFNCDTMNQAWNTAKCVNFQEESPEGYPTMQEFITQAQGNSCGAGSMQVSLDASRADKPEKPLLYFQELGAGSCANSPLISTGLSVKPKGQDGAGNQSQDPFADAVCLNPACVVQGGRCVDG